MAGALEGVRVLDCTQIIAGPLSASLLSEMGAEVVKIEPLEGEPWRLQAELLPKESRQFLTQNRGKLSLAVDLKHAEAPELRDRLIRWADVVITNYRPGVAESLGLGYDSVRALNPSVIYCECTAFGNRGPNAQRRGYDIVAQAVSGVATSNPHIREGIPQIVGFAPADLVTGFSMAMGICGALYHRALTGEGQRLDASLLGTAMFLQAGTREILALDGDTRASWLAQLDEMRSRGAAIDELYAAKRARAPELAGNVYYRIYQTKDGHIAVGCLGPGPRARFRQALEFRDPRYEAGFESTPQNVRRVGDELTALCEGKMRAETTDFWLEKLDALDIACGPLKFVEEMASDPQVAANEYLIEYDHTLFGPLRGPAPVVKMSGTPTRVQRASPALGEHTDQVLCGLGYSEDAIAKMRDGNLVG